ncbi:MAG: hypothetical protein QOE41_3687 [Mycobacterium sp.]|jgi:hypothetical protein|nr:putative conserved transrane protein [Mycobacterium sp.]MDT5134376.1 hypothetical protein [Mycobacterium sp.]
MRKGAEMTRIAACCAAAFLVVAGLTAAPSARALPNDTNPGDIQVTGIGTEPTLECRGHTLYVNGSNNVITVTDACYAVTLQGSHNTVVVDTVINDIQVYGFNQTVLYKNGDPYVWDRGRDLGMTNQIDRIPA